MKTVNIICYSRSIGLTRDVVLVSGVLSAAGFRVLVNNHPLCAGGRMRRVAARTAGAVRKLVRHGIRGRTIADINIFVERLVPRLMPLAGMNCMLPNPEWFDPAMVPHLSRMDRVLCKTRQAEAIFGGMNLPTSFIGFTSLDRRRPAVARRRDFLHAAGSSPRKGTQLLVDTWARHPEWPHLTVVQRRDHARPVPAGNVTHIVDVLADEAIIRLQNEHVFHICPSRSEGFGHYIVEGLGCGALVLVTDGAPMNEVVDHDRGVLIGVQRSLPDRLGLKYVVEPAALERAVETALALDEAELAHRRDNARSWFEANDTSFRERLVHVVAEL